MTTTLTDTDRACLSLGKRGAFEGVARRHGRRRNPARKLPRSMLRTPENQLRLTPQRVVEKCDRSVANSETPQPCAGNYESPTPTEEEKPSRPLRRNRNTCARDPSGADCWARTVVELRERPVGSSKPDQSAEGAEDRADGDASRRSAPALSRDRQIGRIPVTEGPGSDHVWERPRSRPTPPGRHRRSPIAARLTTHRAHRSVPPACPHSRTNRCYR